MKSITIITDTPLELAALAESYKYAGQVRTESGKRMIVEGDWGWFAFAIDEPPIDDFEASELHEVKSRISRPSFSLLEFRNTASAEIAILGLPSGREIVIDNDHGLIVPIEEIRRRIREGSEWQMVSS
jgi:hypothetical protein